MSNLLTPYIKAGYPVIYLQTPEENRAEMTVFEAAKECKRTLEVWSHTDGFTVVGTKVNGKAVAPTTSVTIQLKNGMKNDSATVEYLNEPCDKCE